MNYSEGVFIAEGWSGDEPAEGWASVFPVTAGDGADAQPLLGDYSRDGSRLFFTPRFPPTGGVSLHARFRPPRAAEIAFDVTLPSPAIASTTRVVSIDPSGDTWLANTLRMYVTFSAPMRTGDAYAHIRVLDPAGMVIEKPFVEIEQELWDPSFQRLTILFDPGRIKRGLVDNETAGPPLVPGRDVTLVVEPSWRDARGAPLTGEFRRTIRVSPAERRPLVIGEWTITPPSAPQANLVIDFHRPMDAALALRSFTLSRASEIIAGRAELTDGGTVWRFTPDRPWRRGRHDITVNGVLEDIAGNRLGRPFDVDTRDPAQARPVPAEAHLSFEPGQ